MVIVLTIHVLFSRPYRSFSSNLLYVLCLISFLSMMIMMYLKIQGSRQSIFIDKYFFMLTLFLSGFMWFLVICVLLYCFLSCKKWTVDKQVAMVLTEGQDLAVFYIKDARNFIVDIWARKKYTAADSTRMN